MMQAIILIGKKKIFEQYVAINILEIFCLSKDLQYESVLFMNSNF